MKIAIIGTRGIPNHYGGFEQFAEYLSLDLVKRGHTVTVYNSASHPYQKKIWNGVNIVHCYDPESRIGTIGQFIYDLNCILDTRRKDFDIILQLGYTSSSVWNWLLPKRKSIVTTNMDGLEWKRSKFSAKVQKFLKYAESLAVKNSNYLISDSVGIQQYILETYKKDSIFIPYGAHLFKSSDEQHLLDYKLKKYDYDMLVARLEPENSIEIILDGVVLANLNRSFIVIGKHETEFGNYLKNKYRDKPNIHFIGGVYNIEVLNNLRHYSNLYFHGHTVGGTNPSLLEAMASQALIAAHNNIFNQSILKEHAFYFATADEVQDLLETIEKSKWEKFITINEKKVVETYSWNIIIDQYEQHFKEIYSAKYLK